MDLEGVGSNTLYPLQVGRPHEVLKVLHVEVIHFGGAQGYKLGDAGWRCDEDHSALLPVCMEVAKLTLGPDELHHLVEAGTEILEASHGPQVVVTSDELHQGTVCHFAPQ